MRRRFLSRFLILCTVVFAAGMAATTAADRDGSKTSLTPVEQPAAIQHGQSRTLNLEPSTGGSELVVVQLDGDRTPLVSCPIAVLPGNNSTSQNGRAPMSNFLASRAHWLDLATEITASGFPSGAVPQAIGFTYTIGSGTPATGNLKIYLENTANTTNIKSSTWATAIASMTKVSDSTVTLPGTAGTFHIPFSGGSPFTYTGGGLYIAYDWSWPGPVPASFATTLCSNTLAGGLLGANSAAATVAPSAFRPETWLQPDFGGLTNDRSVDHVYAVGALPTPLVGPQIFRANVSNRGSNPATNLPVNLDVTGADPFSDTQIVPTLAACGGTTNVTFASFTPTAIGANTVTVEVDPDDNNANNSVSKPLDETFNRYSYKHAGTVSTGGIGLTGAGAMVAKFTITEPAKVADIELEFALASGATYKLAIYGDNAGSPSTTALYVDAGTRTVSAVGPTVITLPAPVAVPAGNFYVGLHQLTATNVNLAYDQENVLRPATFFLSPALPPAGWIDFSPANAFKLNIGVRLVQCSIAADCNDSNACTNDACVNELCEYTNNTDPCSDGNACTSPDVCAGGVCTPGPNPCNDGFACTNDICDGIGGCTYTAVTCNDSNPCTTDSCVEPTGCVFAPTTGPACTDGNVCTIGDTCQSGVCVGGPLPPATQFCSSAAIVIPTTATAATPYPSQINVAGLGSVCKVTVSLRGVNHTWPDDIDVMLSGPAGQNSTVMSDVGGSNPIAAPGVNLTFDDAAANSLTAAPLTSGTFKPSDIDPGAGGGDNWAAPAPASLGGTALSIYNGTNPTGLWKLWVTDDFAGDAGSIGNGWCLNIVGSPCVNNADCNDGDACNGVESCNAGVCQPGTSIVCDDGLFCTLDSCTPSTGDCVFATNTCNDLDGCSTDTCDENGNQCLHSNNCVQFCSSGAITIPPGGAATPYPSNIAVSGVIFPANVISIQLDGFSHLFPDDVDILVEGPVDPGQNIKLMSDAGGGTAVTNVNLKFTDGAPLIPNGGPLVSGTYAPSDYINANGTDAFPAPAPPWSGSLAVSNFNGNPNGTFKLYVFDEFTPDDGSLAGWCVNILPIGCQDAAECDDGNICTQDICSAGACSNVFSTAVCDDFNPCTTETCSADDGCGYLPVSCDDGLSCTSDSCVDFQGCQNTPTGPADAVGNTVNFTTNTNLDWSSEPVGPYNVYRGSQAAAFGAYNHTCFANGTGTPTASDATTPTLGGLFYYLVSRDNNCGESNLGTRVDSGVPSNRPNAAPCP